MTGPDMAAIITAIVAVVGSVGGGIGWLNVKFDTINKQLRECQRQHAASQQDMSTISMCCGLLIEEIVILQPRGNVMLERVGTMLKAAYAPEETTPSWTGILNALDAAERRKHDQGEP